jgi:hypothetical protein
MFAEGVSNCFWRPAFGVAQPMESVQNVDVNLRYPTAYPGSSVERTCDRKNRKKKRLALTPYMYAGEPRARDEM